MTCKRSIQINTQSRVTLTTACQRANNFRYKPEFAHASAFEVYLLYAGPGNRHICGFILWNEHPECAYRSRFGLRGGVSRFRYVYCRRRLVWLENRWKSQTSHNEAQQRVSWLNLVLNCSMRYTDVQDNILKGKHATSYREKSKVSLSERAYSGIPIPPRTIVCKTATTLFSCYPDPVALTYFSHQCQAQPLPLRQVWVPQTRPLWQAGAST